MAVAIMHFPLSFVETTLLSILSYFIAGLSNADGAGNFFYFYFMMIAMAYYGLALARLLAYTMPNNSVGSVFCSGMPHNCNVAPYSILFRGARRRGSIASVRMCATDV
jgi:ABC-type multidrug transport system permease subunit